MHAARRTPPTLLALVLLSTPLAVGETLDVRADYPTIQACIDAAVSGDDECVVAPGTYNETINFLGKAITVRSSHGAEATTIDATDLGGSVVTCANGEGSDTVLDGFTITGGTGTLIGSRRYGGGMYSSGSAATVTRCVFVSNTAYGGGGMLNDSSGPTVRDCTFTRNLADYGGGMMNTNSRPALFACTFHRNNGRDGGGIFNNFSNPTITRCTFLGNHADLGGAVQNYVSHPMLSSSTFVGNTAAMAGGGMANVGSSPTVAHCTFSRNAAPAGGALSNRGGSALVINCVLWGDSSGEVSDDAAHPTIKFGDVQGGLPLGAVDGGGNIDRDPRFVRPPDPGPDGEWDDVDDDSGDLRLQPDSPCINTGDPEFVPQSGETDFDGHARLLCERVDMGAYEQGIGDYDCDLTVDLTDFAKWPACRTQPQSAGNTSGCESFDFDGDGDVDLRDFGGFQRSLVP